LRRLVPSARRLLTLTGASLLGTVAAVAMFASPASAHPAELTGVAKCGEKPGTWEVKWTLENKFDDSATITEVTATPFGSTVKIVDPDNHVVEANGTREATQFITKENLGDGPLAATASVKLTFAKDGFELTVKGKVALEEKCLAETPPPPPAPAPPPPAPVPPPAPGAPPALPKTGDNTGIYAAVALVLAGLGAGLFLIARKRRFKFTA
jgi:LPXTG-motif cell wall-anchored protein